MPDPARIGILLAAADDDGRRRRSADGAAEAAVEVGAEAVDLGERILPVLELEAAEVRAAQQREFAEPEFPGAEDRHGPAVLVAPVEKHAAGEDEQALAVGLVGVDPQVRGAGKIGAHIDEAVEAGAQGVGVLGVAVGDILPLLRVDEAVAGADAGGGVEAGDVEADAEGPTGDAELVVLRLEPVAGRLDETVEPVAARHLGGEDEDFAQHAIGLATHREKRRAVARAVEVVERLVDVGGLQDLWRARGGRQRGEIELGAEELPPLARGVLPVERDGAGPGPDLGGDAEAAAPCGEVAREPRDEVVAIESVETEEDAFVDARADVDADRLTRGIQPAGNLQRGRGEAPVGGLIDAEGDGRNRSGHRG